MERQQPQEVTQMVFEIDVHGIFGIEPVKKEPVEQEPVETMRVSVDVEPADSWAEASRVEVQVPVPLATLDAIEDEAMAYLNSDDLQRELGIRL